MKLKNRMVQTNYGWSYPIEGKFIDGNTFRDLLKKCREYYAINGVEVPPNLEELIEDHVAQRSDPAYVRGEADKFFLTFNRLWTGTKAIVKLLLSGKFATKEEAVRRAYVCKACPANVNLAGCFSCFLSEVGAEKVKKKYNLYIEEEKYLRACKICGCTLSLLVHVDSSLLKGDHHDYPENCWKRKL